jgi:hypothetical protein
MSVLREIVPDVLTWPWFSERFGYDFNGYAVRAPAGALVIDPVQMSDDVLDALADEEVGEILVTNRNHFRDAARLAARTGAPVRVHPADAGFVRDQGVPVGGTLSDGERAGPLEVVGCPGKSPGEVALHWP